jgi:hypothetical protein
MIVITTLVFVDNGELTAAVFLEGRTARHRNIRGIANGIRKDMLVVDLRLREC